MSCSGTIYPQDKKNQLTTFTEQGHAWYRPPAPMPGPSTRGLLASIYGREPSRTVPRSPWDHLRQHILVIPEGDSTLSAPWDLASLEAQMPTATSSRQEQGTTVPPPEMRMCLCYKRLDSFPTHSLQGSLTLSYPHAAVFSEPSAR